MFHTMRNARLGSLNRWSGEVEGSVSSSTHFDDPPHEDVEQTVRAILAVKLFCQLRWVSTAGNLPPGLTGYNL